MEGTRSLHNSSILNTINKDNLAFQVMNNDHLKGILGKSSNSNCKYYKNKHLPKMSDSPFGDFPKGQKLQPISKQSYIKGQQNMKKTQSITKLNKHTGNGGMTSSILSGKLKPLQQAPKCGALLKRDVIPTEFRRSYDRGDLPIRNDYQSAGCNIIWKVPPTNLDYHHYLPIFFDGLRQKADPYRHFAILGVQDLLQKGQSKILPVIPQLVIPIKNALNTRDPQIIAVMLKILQKLVISSDMIGQSLVPYYRQILPMCNLYKNSNVNIGDSFEYSQRKRSNLGDLILQTLELLQQTGGQDAYINIKYMIPTYQSCQIN